MKAASPLDSLIKALAGLPGLGPRSARRIALHLLTQQEKTMKPLMAALQDTAQSIVVCGTCGGLDRCNPCSLCADPSRSRASLCVVSGIADQWAIERTGAFRGQYHILGGVLSALDGIGPDDLRMGELLERLNREPVDEVILALGATVDGQTTAHVLSDRLRDLSPMPKITRLAHGVPMGGELDYLDEGTIITALKSRAGL